MGICFTHVSIILVIRLAVNAPEIRQMLGRLGTSNASLESYPYHPCMAYLPTFGWFLWQMWVNIPYMDGMGYSMTNVNLCPFLWRFKIGSESLPYPLEVLPRGSRRMAGSGFSAFSSCRVNFWKNMVGWFLDILKTGGTTTTTTSSIASVCNGHHPPHLGSPKIQWSSFAALNLLLHISFFIPPWSLT